MIPRPKEELLQCEVKTRLSADRRHYDVTFVMPDGEVIEVMRFTVEVWLRCQQACVNAMSEIAQAMALWMVPEGLKEKTRMEVHPLKEGQMMPEGRKVEVKTPKESVN